MGTGEIVAALAAEIERLQSAKASLGGGGRRSQYEKKAKRLSGRAPAA